MTTTEERTVQVYRVWIKASAQTIWDAIVKPEWTDRYGYTGLAEFDLRAGGAMRIVSGEGIKAAGYDGVMVEGEVVEATPPRRLVQTWRLTMAPELASEPMTRLTYDIEQAGEGVCRLTITHDLTGAPGTAMIVKGQEEPGAPGGGGWAWVLSDLKSLLETGKAMAG